MTYAITMATGVRGVHLVSCAACRSDLGTMRGDTIRRAIAAKGPIICPECRLRKCDFCGRLTQRRLPLTGAAYGAGAYRVCPLCVQKKLNQRLPNCEKVLNLAGQKELALNEELTTL